MRNTGREWNKSTGLLLSVLTAAIMLEGEVTVGFEDLPLTVPPMQEYAGQGGGLYYDGSDGAGGFESGGVYFENNYNEEWMSWIGWAYSTTTDTETAGFGNQYSSFAGSAASGNVYAVTYAPSEIILPVGAKSPVSIAVSNTTYAGISVRDGDDFAKKFEEGDYFKLTISGYGQDGQVLGAVDVYLADFRVETEPKSVLEGWKEVSLSELAGETGNLVHKIGLSLDSTDSAPWGINTPSYVAIDNMVLGESPTWGGFDLEASGWVDTGDFLGVVYPVGEFVWFEALEKWTYLPASQMGAGTGAWMYLPK